MRRSIKDSHWRSYFVANPFHAKSFGCSRATHDVGKYVRAQQASEN